MGPSPGPTGGMAKGNGALKISQLRAFAAVVEQGSFSAAALHLGTAQSTVSHAIATLEADLGVVLLLRGRAGAVATHILPGVISRFRQDYPAISVEIVECDRYVDAERALQAGQVDLGFTLMPDAPNLQAWELFREEFVALLPPADPMLAKPQPEAVNATVSWAVLAGYARIANKRSVLHNQLVEEHLARFGYRLPVDYEVREDSTLMGLVEKGLGAAVLARLEAEPVPPGVRVYSLPEPLERVVGVAMLENAMLPRAVFAFLDVLRSTPMTLASLLC